MSREKGCGKSGWGKLKMATKERLGLPRGIRVGSRQGQGRSKPHFAEWRIDGKKRSLWFHTIGERDMFARKLAGDVKESGVAAYRMDQTEAREWRAFRAQLGEKVDLTQVLDCWRRYGVERPRLLLSEAAEKFMAVKESEQLDPLTLSHYRAIYDQFSAGLKDPNVHEIKLEQILAWLLKLEFEPETKHTVASRVRGLFRWLKVTRVLIEDPCDGWKLPKFAKKPIKVLSVPEAQKLFKVSPLLTKEVYGRLALEAFAGIRFDTVKKMPAADIKFDRLGIEIPAQNIKTEDREFIDGLPENLWAWLKWSEPDNWILTPRQYLTAKGKAFTAAGVVNPGNALRKSFATYHIAKNKDAAATSIILCHTSPKRLWRSYKGKAAEAEGREYFEILP